MKSRAVILVGLVSGWVGPAFAGAWTQQAGHGQLFVTGIHSVSSKGFDTDGDSIDIPDYKKTEVYATFEYGLSDDLTVLFTPSFRAVSIDGTNDDTSGLGYTDLGARYRFATSDDWTFSAQALARIPGKRREDNFAQVGSTDAEYDFRGQAGVGFGDGNFASIEAGYRLRVDDPPNEYKLDLTLGLRATDDLLFIASSYSTLSDGGGQGIFLNRFGYHNVYLSAVYDVSESVSLQLGLMGTIAGENALRERGATLGLWYRF